MCAACRAARTCASCAGAGPKRRWNSAADSHLWYCGDSGSWMSASSAFSATWSRDGRCTSKDTGAARKLAVSASSRASGTVVAALALPKAKSEADNTAASSGRQRMRVSMDLSGGHSSERGRMASQGRARPLATNGAIMSTRKRKADAGRDRWPRRPRHAHLTAATDNSKTQRCQCIIATLHIRRLSPSASAGRGACKDCHQSDGGSGAGTIRAMSTAEMPAGEIVSPPARCACLRLQVPLQASWPAWPSHAARRCREHLRAPIARTCSRSRPHLLRRDCGSPCDHCVLPMPPVGRQVYA